MSQESVVIVAAKRTPMGAFQGSLAGLSAPQLGASALKGCLDDIHCAPDLVEEVLMGCVLPAGLGQAPARQATLAAGMPAHVGATTVNKVCGSGLKAVMLATDMIRLGDRGIVLAGGMESMSNAPYLLLKARAGLRMGHQQIMDHMMMDGLEDAYNRGCAMGVFAEQAVARHGFTREAQDAFAIASTEKALKATAAQHFLCETIPVMAPAGRESVEVAVDEGPTKVKVEKIPSLKPAFADGGTVTAANSSSISDGAAALCLMSESAAKAHGFKPRAYIRGHASHAQTPAEFTDAPVGAIQTLLKKLDWKIEDVDLFEINEAFAVVTMIAMKELKLDPAKVNVHGGACALGHPIGASGARILVTLLYALETYNLKRGIATLCIGGGEAVAVAIERA